MFWNAEFNAVAALPALFDVFLRDTQKVPCTLVGAILLLVIHFSLAEIQFCIIS